MPGKVKNQVVDTKKWDTAKLINIGHMAKTYGMLPSEVLARATSFDIMVSDVYATWEKHLTDQATGKSSLDSMSTEQLQEILEKSRGG